MVAMPLVDKACVSAGITQWKTVPIITCVIFCQEITRCFSLGAIFEPIGINTLISSQTQCNVPIKLLMSDLLHNPFSRLTAQLQLDLTDRISFGSKLGGRMAWKRQVPCDAPELLPSALLFDASEGGIIR